MKVKLKITNVVTALNLETILKPKLNFEPLFHLHSKKIIETGKQFKLSIARYLDINLELNDLSDVARKVNDRYTKFLLCDIEWNFAETQSGKRHQMVLYSMEILLTSSSRTRRKILTNKR